MLRLLRFLWTGSWHEHKWKQVDSTNVFVKEIDTDRPNYIILTLQCETCGEIKTTRIG